MQSLTHIQHEFSYSKTIRSYSCIKIHKDTVSLIQCLNSKYYKSQWLNTAIVFFAFVFLTKLQIGCAVPVNLDQSWLVFAGLICLLSTGRWTGVWLLQDGLSLDDLALLHMVSSSRMLAWVCSHRRAKGPKREPKNVWCPEAQTLKWHSITFATFCWPKQVTCPNPDVRSERTDSLMGVTVKTHCKG